MNFEKTKVLYDLVEFTNQRILGHLEELSLNKELINSICNSYGSIQTNIFDIVDLKNRVNVVNKLKEKENFSEIQSVISRISKLANIGGIEKNILLSEGYIKPELFEKKCEFKIFEFIQELEKLFLLPSWDYFQLFDLYESNTNNLKELFDPDKGVLVMAEDVDIRNNRLNLLGLIRNYSLKIADFTALNF